MTLAQTIVERAEATGRIVATAESCTGGLVAAALTGVPGASSVFGTGIVAYANEAKAELLGVREETLARYGAVSEETAREMASGVAALSRADVAISVTGIAGPGGGSDDKPVGLVWFGLWAGGEARAARRLFAGQEREEVRAAAVQEALRLLADAL